MAKKLDTLYNYETPEGVELSFALAGPLPRGLAWLIDMAIRIVCYIILGIGTSLIGEVGTGLMLIGIFLIEWFYPVIFEIKKGMTPGKKVIGLQVVQDEGTPVSWTSSLLRNLIRCVDFLPFLNMVGLVTMFLNPKFKRLGDLAAGTLVVYRKDRGKDFKIPEAKSYPPSVPLKLDEQRLILDYCERSHALSKGRRVELTSYLHGLAGHQNPEATILSFGNWFLRGKK